MFQKFAVALCALLVLSGCSYSRKSVSSMSDSSLASEFERQVGDRVFFGFDSTELNTESKAQLDRQAEWLKKHNVKVVVEGHCDERGTREYNLALGERRAEAAKRYLVSKGLHAQSVETISYGKERPAVIGDTEAAYHLNRRSVTVIK